ncbi:hypothetical protein Pla110_40810 [Polystyrenella longa]|uniref:Putative Flp pilus-assembly TadG-like N-terminal domain-containing protein n=1 Tax=Polystyrenella longa TaxID=2528007 RepID=A0A518CSY5_9PLAN|nr:pilus assembly protein TadG-related protein [Polystyrenella longa]QDU82326.1 hypothetical protein Pla110_40810 [Polystyrenella longa]
MIQYSRQTKARPETRKGSILPLTAFFIVILMMITALVVDIGMIAVTSGRLQTAADAAALSAAQTVANEMKYVDGSHHDNYQATECAIKICQLHAGADMHQHLRLLPTDIIYSRSSDRLDSPLNVVQATVRRDDMANGSIPMAFSPVIGIKQTNLERTAKAGFFPAGGIGAGAKILPIAVDATIWTAMRLGNDITNKVLPYDAGEYLHSVTPGKLTSLLKGRQRLLDKLGVPFDLNGNPLMIMDRRCWHPDSQTVTDGPDMLWEGLFLPHQFEQTKLFGSILKPLTRIQYIPGNMVVLNLSSQENWKLGAGLGTLERQIVTGLDFNDVAGVNEMNGKNSEYLSTPFVAQGMYQLPGALEDELRDSIGKPRIIFLYATIPGVLTTVGDLLQFPSKFVIVGWVGGVITDVEFDALVHYVKIQPAPYFDFSLKRATGEESNDFSSGVFAGPHLIE